MMRVVFFDKLRETYAPFGGVTLINSEQRKINGRYVNCWCLYFENGKQMTFKQKDYVIDRVEI